MTINLSSTLPSTKSDAPWLESLKIDGFAVIPSVIPQERVDQYIDSAFSWLEKFPLGFDHNNQSTWTDEHLPVSNKGGLYNRYSVGHEDWVWKIRSEPGVIKVFAELWGTDQLIVSFDGVNITQPHGEHGRTDIELTPPWPHQDQNPHKQNFELAQGIVALSESGSEDGGLVVLKGSHLMHAAYFAANGGINEAQRRGLLNSYLYTDEQADWYRSQGCEEVKVCCPPGSVIVWDSRLIHWNRMPTGKRTRVATYVCYCPASFASPEDLRKKTEIFKNHQCTTHWPALNDVPILQSGPPQRNGVTDPHHRDSPWDEPDLTPVVLRLAGVEAY